MICVLTFSSILTQVPSAYGVTMHCNLMSTQHHEGKQIAREQQQTCIAG